jgi:hypothetical protein
MYTHRKPFPSPKGYNPNAIDADGDGIVQEGTKYERPVKKSKKAAEPVVEETVELVVEDVTESVEPDNIEVEE